MKLPTLPGRCRVMVGAYSYPSLVRLSAFDAEGRELADGLVEVGFVVIGR